MRITGKTAAAAVSAAALVTMSAVPLVTAAPNEIDSTATEATQVAETQALGSTSAQVPHVEGVFSYSQDAVSSNERISTIFAKAAAALCQATPTHAYKTEGNQLVVTRNGKSEVIDIARELGQDDQAGFVMACACATNGPGGGAVANAEVEGAPIASLAKIADAA